VNSFNGTVELGTFTPRWEYLTRRMAGIASWDTLEADLNQLGANGWELAAVVSGVWVFKRPADTDQEP
jgi:hypothetical protein